MTDQDTNSDSEEPRSRNEQSGEQDGGGRDRSRGGRRQFGRRRSRISPLYADKTFKLDYKDPETLRRFLTEHGKIRPRRQTGLYAADQRRLAREVKRARHLALLPFTAEHARSN